ncbi:Uncharacterized protein dnm_100740 [Desulfonema magnum]|uniref:Uncharacterized protein n=2 Tax=Desulfonema magnum TaxID=45655 RepID=A0A975BY64_9BACT|nr:hypothetical protein [Desulfonema magnum]QTA93964.1 Uncharacterized protein dnm_100740 [Desulfonema magnum]
MKKDFGDSIDLHIYKNDSEEAKEFKLRSATNVFVNEERLHIKVALSNDKMRAYLEDKI